MARDLGSALDVNPQLFLNLHESWRISPCVRHSDGTVRIEFDIMRFGCCPSFRVLSNMPQEPLLPRAAAASASFRALQPAELLQRAAARGRGWQRAADAAAGRAPKQRQPAAAPQQLQPCALL